MKRTSLGIPPIERLASKGLIEVFRVYHEKPSGWIQMLREEMSKSTMQRFIEYLTLRKDPEELSQREINGWMLEGIYEAYKKSFRMQPTQESKQLVDLMCNSFQYST